MKAGVRTWTILHHEYPKNERSAHNDHHLYVDAEAILAQ